MKKIGFIDYFLDEWHANNYPQWIRENCKASGRDCDLAYAWAETDKTGGVGTADWCRRFDAAAAASIEELVEKSDYIIVLSPDNSEHHERLSRIPLMSGKPVYIDKTFSPDLSTGIRMFDLAEKYHTPMFSSSALRFAKELSNYPDNKVNRNTLEYVATMGPGQPGLPGQPGQFETYSVHQFEMIVSLMGTGASRIKSLSSESARLMKIEYSDGRYASMHQMPEMPFHLCMQMKGGSGVFVGQCTDIFQRLIDLMLIFFETGKPPVPREETLEIMALIEASTKALQNFDKWVEVQR